MNPVIDQYGNKYWYLYDQLHNPIHLHRVDGPAIERANGNKWWFINDQLHSPIQLDGAYGPAIEWANGDKEWYINGKRHREDGPAVMRTNNDVYKYKYKYKWYINGELIKKSNDYIIKVKSAKNKI